MGKPGLTLEKPRLWVGPLAPSPGNPPHQVRAANADVNDVRDGLARVPFPVAAPDALAQSREMQSAQSPRYKLLLSSILVPQAQHPGARRGLLRPHWELPATLTPQLDPTSSSAKWGTPPPLRIHKTKANSQQNLTYKRPRSVKCQLSGLVCAKGQDHQTCSHPLHGPHQFPSPIICNFVQHPQAE